jgi:TolA-binding protein
MKRHLLVLLLPLLGTGCFKTRQDIAREKEDAEVRSTLQQNIVDYNQGLEKTQADLGRLQGRIEELEHQRKKEMSGLLSGHETERKTIDELKARLAAIQEGQNALFEEIRRLKEDNLATASERSRPAAPTGGKKKVTGPSFEGALGAYKSKDYGSAAAGFRGFLDANPRSKRALDAHFFLGDSLFQQKNFDQAVVEFGVVHEKAPLTPLGRRSTLRIAESFNAMGKSKDARAFALLLVEGSPESKEAKLARRLLK